MSQPIRLLIVTVDAPFFVTHHLPLAEAARKEGFIVHIAAPVHKGSLRDDETAVRRIEGAGFEFHAIPLKRSNISPLAELSLIVALRDLMNRIAPGLVHCIGMKPILYAGSLARIRGLPAVLAVIGLGSTFLRNDAMVAVQRRIIISAFAFASGHSRCCVTVENMDDREMFMRPKAIDPERTFLVPGVGADLALFHPRSPGDDEPEGPPTVMFASRLIAAKGVREFVAAARRIKRAGVPARFVLLGGRDTENPTCIAQTELEEWQKEQIVEWWGYSADMPCMLRRADIFCLPTYYREGVPKVLIEAAATGLPIVTTDIPGCRDVVKHGQNGLLIPPHDIDRLEAALLQLIADTELRRAAGARSREVAVTDFSLQKYLAMSLAIYRKALGRTEPATRGATQ
jgi:glycosyltransferase involved in cell wall biosynthesis